MKLPSIMYNLGTNLAVTSPSTRSSLSLSDSGKTLAVGTRLSGTYSMTAGKVRVYCWDEAASTYSKLGDSLVTKEEYDFGHSVSLSADGKTLAVGAPGMTYYNSTEFVLYGMNLL